MLLYFVYVIAGIYINIIASRGINQCDNQVKYTLKTKTSNRVIIKSELNRKIIAIESCLSFGFLITLIITVMGFTFIKQSQTGIWYYIYTIGFTLIPLLFAWQCYRTIQVSQKIDNL